MDFFRNLTMEQWLVEWYWKREPLVLKNKLNYYEYFLEEVAKVKSEEETELK